MVDEKIFLPDRCKAVPPMVPDTFGKSRPKRFEHQIRPVFGDNFRNVDQRDETQYREYVLVADFQPVLQEFLHFVWQIRVHCQTDDRSSSAFAQGFFVLTNQILGFLFDFDIAIADDLENAPIQNFEAGE